MPREAFHSSDQELFGTKALRGISNTSLLHLDFGLTAETPSKYFWWYISIFAAF